MTLNFDKAEVTKWTGQVDGFTIALEIHYNATSWNWTIKGNGAYATGYAPTRENAELSIKALHTLWTS